MSLIPRELSRMKSLKLMKQRNIHRASTKREALKNLYKSGKKSDGIEKIISNLIPVYVHISI